jgi:hypothetical protein
MRAPKKLNNENQLFPELGDGEKTEIAKSISKFSGTNNPRQLRVIFALEVSPRTREQIDRIAGASNGPELIAELRRRGLQIPCKMTPAIDRDGFEIKRGVYYFTESDKREIRRWKKSRITKK